MRILRDPRTKEKITVFDTLEEMIAASLEAVRPPERITVSQSAERFHIVKMPGAHDGPFSMDKTPYLRKPQDTLMSLDYTGMIFVGPARTGKSAMFLNWLAYTAKCDPVDMMLIHMTQNTARDYSLTDLSKFFRNSSAIGACLVPTRQKDNVFDKSFLSGMRLEIKWPAISNLSGKTVPRLWLMDYDRMEQNVEGEGNPFDLAKKRAQTFKRYGMCAAESSPGFPVTNPKWIPSSRHEAPPTEGILALYNRGDRQRFYWQCPHCNNAFEPDFSLMRWPTSTDFMEASDHAYIQCPHCSKRVEAFHKYELNIKGEWLIDGQTWNPDGSITGVSRRSEIASFWMKGPAAGFMDWSQLVYNYLNAMDEYDRTGSEEALKVTTNVDQGLPYTPKAIEAGRLPEELKARAKPYAKKGHVPDGVRFLVTAIDVQAGSRPSFVCHTYGIAPVKRPDGAWTFDVYHVDMWKIRKSNRKDEDDERALIDPAAYAEDWHILISEVIERTYPLGDGSGRHMAVKLVASDSGGAASAMQARMNLQKNEPTVSVTANAYAFWRYLRDDPQGRNYHHRFHLLKGEPSRTAPPLHQTYPDSGQRDKWSIARGDVPVWAVNSNVVKDTAYNMLGRIEPGGQVHFPIWEDDEGQRIDTDWLYTQLTSEVRLSQGWRNIAKRRNEGFDLLAYCVAFMRHPHIRFDHTDWGSPPGWAREWDANDLVFMPTEHGAPFSPKVTKSKRRSLEDLASDLA